MKTSYQDTNLGVPQGAVLCPLLFYFYRHMNDIKTQLDDDVILGLLYADDLQIYIQVPTDQINHGLLLLSEASCKVSEWAKFNCLKLNAGETRSFLEFFEIFRDISNNF